MLTEYIDAAMKHAKYEILEDDKSYYGEISECPGVYANDVTLEGCRKMLREVLEGWIMLGIRHGATIPVIDGIDVNEHEDAALWAD